MNGKLNLIGLALIVAFITVFGGVLSIGLFKSGQEPTTVSLDAVAKTPVD